MEPLAQTVSASPDLQAHQRFGDNPYRLLKEHEKLVMQAGEAWW